MISRLLALITFFVLFLAGTLGQTHELHPELGHTKYELEYHVISDGKPLGDQLEALGINEQSEILAYDIEKTSSGVEAQPRAEKLPAIKKWATSHVRSIHSTYCLLRLALNSSMTGWVLYRFYDLTYLHPASLVAGAAMAGTLSLTFMAYSIPLDRWMMKSKILLGQFSRYTLISLVYMAALKASYLSTELLVSGTDFMTLDLMRAELVSMMKAFTASAAPMLAVFWNAYRKENRDATIQTSPLTTEQKELEHTYQRVVSETTSFFSSMITNTVGLLSSTTSLAAFDFASYALTLGAGGLFIKEHRIRSRRMKTCQFALQGS